MYQPEDEVGQPPHPDIIYYPGAGAGNVGHHHQQQPQGGGVHYIQASEQQQSYYDAGGAMHQPMLHQVYHQPEVQQPQIQQHYQANFYQQQPQQSIQLPQHPVALPQHPVHHPALQIQPISSIGSGQTSPVISINRPAAMMTQEVMQTGVQTAPSLQALSQAHEPATAGADVLSTPTAKAPTTPKKKRTPGSSKKPTPASEAVSAVKDFVSRLLAHKLPEFTDTEFGERILTNITKKITPSMMEHWERSIRESDPSTDCVVVSRPKEGRITVSKSGVGATGSKKVFPQIVVYQMFRNTKIVFHNDIKSSPTSNCKNHSAIKPPATPAAGGDNADCPDVSSDLICLNPFHYEVTPEADMRMSGKKSESKKPTATSAGKSNVPTPPKGQVFEDDGTDYIKLWDETAQQPSDDDEESCLVDLDEEKMFSELSIVEWSDKDKKFTWLEEEAIDRLRIREEISQLVFSGKYIDAIYEEKKKASERKKAQKETTERSKLEIISKPLCQLSEETQEPSPKKSPSLSDHREKPKEARVPDLPKHHSSDQQYRMGDIVLEPIVGSGEGDSPGPHGTDMDTSPEPSPSNHAAADVRYLPPAPATTTATDVAMGSGDKDGDGGDNEGDAGPDEDIQNLLQDIQGSFERQFDDGLAPPGGSGAGESDDDGTPFGSIANTFTISAVSGAGATGGTPAPGDSTSSHQPHQPNFNAVPHDGGVSQSGVEEDGLPCIISSWGSVADGGGSGAAGDEGDGGGFLNAGTISQEEFDNFFPNVAGQQDDAAESFTSQAGNSSTGFNPNFDPFQHQ